MLNFSERTTELALVTTVSKHEVNKCSNKQTTHSFAYKVMRVVSLNWELDGFLLRDDDFLSCKQGDVRVPANSSPRIY